LQITRKTPLRRIIRQSLQNLFTDGLTFMNETALILNLFLVASTDQKKRLILREKLLPKTNQISPLPKFWREDGTSTTFFASRKP